MRSTILYALALCIAASSARDLTASLLSTAIVSNVCDEQLTTNCIPAASTITGAPISSVVSSKLHTITTHSSHKSNHSSTATMHTISTSTISYTNTSIISSTHTTHSNSLPTSIIVATGTPTIPTIQQSTITSFTIVPPAATSGTSTLAPTTQNSATRDGKVVGLPGLALVLLVVSALVMV